jgi:hypothetical protein
MFDNLVVDGTILLLLVVIAVIALQIINGAIERYRLTNYVAFKTGITVAELRKMLENRRLQTHNR